MTASHPSCIVCSKGPQETSLFPIEMLRQPIVSLIRQDYDDVTTSDSICMDDLKHYRTLHLHALLSAHKPPKIPASIIKSITENTPMSQNLEDHFSEQETFAQRLADYVAEFGGSWSFILFFSGLIAIWIFINTAQFFANIFDPYPYILLNLVLGCIAAVQAPIIMMSQNRQEQRDRARGELDYQINLKAELEVRSLNTKLDHLMHVHWQHFKKIEALLQSLEIKPPHE